MSRLLTGFIDRGKISVTSGSGGGGCTSFDRNRMLRHPRPNGGGGGDGGDVIIKVDSHVHTLLDFQYRRHFKAKSGFRGEGNNKKGARGEDCVIKVPPGTVIKDASSGAVLRDLDFAGKQVIVCRGGGGGKGNSPRREATPGGRAEERLLILELKVLADVGIVGFPNAGKSTLISGISKARPKIAGFPFTTKAPVLGIAELSGGRRFVACEIPGLIEGAHSGKGLGLEFLRHAERTKVLIHLVDAASVEGRNPYQDYLALNKELEFYGMGLAGKPQLVAANKMDLAQAKKNIAGFKSAVKKNVYPISAVSKEGTEKLLEAVWEELQKGE